MRWLAWTLAAVAIGLGLARAGLVIADAVAGLSAETYGRVESSVKLKTDDVAKTVFEALSARTRQ